MRKWRHESVLDLYNLILALLLFVSPLFLARASGTAVVDLRASGAAIALLSLVAMFAYASWQEWVNLLLGVWLIVSPWLLGFAHTSAIITASALALRSRSSPRSSCGWSMRRTTSSQRRMRPRRNSPCHRGS